MATVTNTGPGTYSVTLTAREQAVATRVAGQRSVTVERALESLIERKLNEFFVQFKDREAAARQEAYDTASAPVRASVDTALNFTVEG